MKLEVRENMYCRTRGGAIGKIVSLEDVDEREYKLNGFYIGKDAIKKASYSIIDILEEGDYVNGYKVSLKGYDYAHFVQCDYPIENGTTNHYKFYEQAIKSVVTKKQFENMTYNVGE